MRRAGWVLLGLVGVVAFALGPAASAAVSGAEQKLQAALADDLRRNPGVPGEALAVSAPGLDVAVAVGKADVQAGTRLEADTPFRVASVTKTFVAAAILRLVERHQVELDACLLYTSPSPRDS